MSEESEERFDGGEALVTRSGSVFTPCFEVIEKVQDDLVVDGVEG
jgi:hypothetical protein